MNQNQDTYLIAPLANSDKYGTANRETTTFRHVVLAALFAITTIVFFSEVRSDYFSPAGNYDRYNYVETTEYLKKVGAVDDTNINGIMGLLSAELGWQYILLGIAHVFQLPETGLNLIAIIVLGIFALFCLRHNTPPSITFVFLINPIVIDLVMCQSRSALALAILILAQMSGKKIWYLIGGLAAQSIHFSAVIFIAVYAIAQYVSVNTTLFSFDLKKFFVVFFGVLLALSVTFGRTVFMNITGDYRFTADYASSSLLYAAFWFILLFSLVLLPKNSDKISWQYYYAIFVLTLFFIFSIAKFYNTRFIALTFPIILNSIRDMPRNAQYLLYGGFFVYQAVQYYYWTL